MTSPSETEQIEIRKRARAALSTEETSSMLDRAAERSVQEACEEFKRECFEHTRKRREAIPAAVNK